MSLRGVSSSKVKTREPVPPHRLSGASGCRNVGAFQARKRSWFGLSVRDLDAPSSALGSQMEIETRLYKNLCILHTVCQIFMGRLESSFHRLRSTAPLPGDTRAVRERKGDDRRRRELAVGIPA